MNKVILEGTVVGWPISHTYKYGDLIQFKVSTLSQCVNHKTGQSYLREDKHNVVCWDHPTRMGNVRRRRLLSAVYLNGGEQVRVEGKLRTKIQGFETVVSVEATSIKVKVGRYYRDIQTGRFA